MSRELTTKPWIYKSRVLASQQGAEPRRMINQSKIELIQGELITKPWIYKSRVLASQQGAEPRRWIVKFVYRTKPETQERLFLQMAHTWEEAMDILWVALRRHNYDHNH